MRGSDNPTPKKLPCPKCGGLNLRLLTKTVTSIEHLPVIERVWQCRACKARRITEEADRSPPGGPHGELERNH